MGVDGPPGTGSGRSPVGSTSRTTRLKSPPPSEQLFNSQAAAAVEGGPCSSCAKSFQHCSTIVSEEEGKLNSDILQENTSGTKKTKEARRNAQRRRLRQEKFRDFPPT